MWNNLMSRFIKRMSLYYWRRKRVSRLKFYDMPNPRTDVNNERSVEELLDRVSRQHLGGHSASSSSARGTMTVE